MKKSWILLCFMLCIAIVIFAGCSNNNEQGNSGDNQQASKNNSGGNNAEGESSNELPMVNGKYDPPVTITTVKGVSPGWKFKPGESMEDNVMTKWAEERLGIQVKYDWTVTDTNEAFSTKLRLALASSEPLPDVIYIGGNNPQIMHDLIDSGRFQEVGSLFDQYASETWKKAMSIDETVWYTGMRDGEKYAIPNLELMGNGNTVLWLREDWRVELGLPEPKTIEDLEVIMEAFKNEKGVKTPLSIGYTTGFISNVGDTAPIFGAYGSIPGIWQLDDNGDLEYGSIQPGIKSALEKLHDWNKKGYISSESALWDGTKATEPFLAGDAGIIIGAPWMPQSRFRDLYVNEPDAQVRPFDIPMGPDGDAGRKVGSIVQGYMLVNKDMEHPEILFTYQNYMVDNYGTRKEGSEFQYGVAQGYDWDIVDGVPTTDPSKIEDHIQAFQYPLFGTAARIPDKFFNLRLDINEKLKKGIELTDQEKIEHGQIAPSWEGYMTAYSTPESYNKKDIFTGAPTPAMIDNKEYLDTLELETFAKIIYGDLPISEFDNFVEQWKSSGGDEINKEVNEWYSSIK